MDGLGNVLVLQVCAGHNMVGVGWECCQNTLLEYCNLSLQGLWSTVLSSCWLSKTYFQGLESPRTSRHSRTVQTLLELQGQLAGMLVGTKEKDIWGSLSDWNLRLFTNIHPHPTPIYWLSPLSLNMFSQHYVINILIIFFQWQLYWSFVSIII